MKSLEAQPGDDDEFKLLDNLMEFENFVPFEE
jgi:hypothetical protein